MNCPMCSALIADENVSPSRSTASASRYVVIWNIVGRSRCSPAAGDHRALGRPGRGPLGIRLAVEEVDLATGNRLGTGHARTLATRSRR